MPGLNCEKLSCVEQKYVEDKLCQRRNVKSREVQVKICPTKVGEAHFWCRRPKNVIYCQFGCHTAATEQLRAMNFVLFASD